MKNIEELFSRFGNLHDLPVSEEVLGAYVEGNLTPFETDEVNRLCEDEPVVSSVMEEIQSDTTEVLDGLNAGNAILESVGSETIDYSHPISSIVAEEGIPQHCADTDMAISNLFESDTWNSNVFDSIINDEFFSSVGDSLDSYIDSIDTDYPLLDDSITDFDI